MAELLHKDAIELLKQLIQCPSFSTEEEFTANIIEDWFKLKSISSFRENNNIWAHNKYFENTKPTILLNSHHDTVKPNKGYTKDPFNAEFEDGKLFGLGSNDAGGCLVSLMAVFNHFYAQQGLNYNLVLAATAEEENSGPNGLNSLIDLLPKIDFAIVGEPTEMHLAIAEKGLLVIDGLSSGTAGHAAHENTKNPIHKALSDIEWINSFEFSQVSNVLGKVKMSVTQIQAGEQHNLVPAVCNFVIDVRVNENYSNQEVFNLIDQHTKSELTARSFNLNSSSISIDHPIVKSGIELGRKTYGSPTLSDQAVLSCPSLKIGPGLSSRSHSANEFIHLHEIEEGIDIYIKLLNKIL